MKWKLLQGGLFLLLCGLLTVAEAENENNFEGHVTRGEVKVPPQALRHLVEPTATTYDNDGATNGPGERVQLPSMECSEDRDCRQYSSSLPLFCYHGQCSCRPPRCWVYEYIITGTFTAKNEFSCGECGVLGSSCNATIQCDYPGECWSDGYCHCPSGENYDGVCLTSNLNWTNTLAFSAMGIVFFIAICILAINCYKQPPWRNSEAWRCRCCPAVAGGRQGRRGSCEKTPAFTIQAHYASQDLTSPQEDVQGASPHGLGGAVPRRPRVLSTNSETTSSISSANTNMTTMSGSVSGYSTARTSPPPSPPPPPPPPPPPAPPPPPSPPPPPPLSSSLSPSSSANPTLSSPLTPSPLTSLLPPLSCSSTASALPHTTSSPPAHALPAYLPLPQDSSNSRDVNGGRETDSSNLKPTEVLPESSNLRPSSSKSSSEIAGTSSSASGGCTHERCQLCLPKAPVSPISAPPRRKTSDRRNINSKSPLLPRTDSSHAENSIELTQL